MLKKLAFFLLRVPTAAAAAAAAAAASCQLPALVTSSQLAPVATKEVFAWSAYGGGDLAHPQGAADFQAPVMTGVEKSAGSYRN